MSLEHTRDIRLIDADALANYANNQIVGITANDIMRFPTVDAEPVKRGRWIKHRIEKYDNYGNYTNAPGPTVCSCCNFSSYGIAEIYNFCPQCGAKMDKEVNK